ncbi:hypothetical protein BDZ45DRAFT_802998 [Acephala macrosclerotiorum]|nr:hypothetical protein BDZ45DRAFT_802998 [Acephala macrosclerotiorum]
MASKNNKGKKRAADAKRFMGQSGRVSRFSGAAKKRWEKAEPKQTYNLRSRPIADLPGPVSKSVPATEFVLFPKLPTEIRLLIWGFVTPEPAFVVESPSRSRLKRNSQFAYTRPNPAILQVCREARYEWLGIANPITASTGSPLEDRNHHLYKWHCPEGRGTRRRAGFWMMPEIDTLWNHTRFRPTRQSTTFQGTLRHLAVLAGCLVSSTRFTETDLDRVCAAYPALETITIMISRRSLEEHFPALPPWPYADEVNGHLRSWKIATKVHPDKLVQWESIKSSRELQDVNNMITSWRASHPGRTLPEIKWRFQQQVFDTENVVLPAPPPVNPYEYLDQALEEIEQARRRRDKQDVGVLYVVLKLLKVPEIPGTLSSA